MNLRQTTLIGLLGALLFVLPGSLQAAESTSYRLYDDAGNAAQGGPMESASYTLNAEESTWRALPGISTNYQITLAHTALSSSSSSSSSSSTSAESDGATGGVRDGGGGRKGIPEGVFRLPADTHSAAPGSRGQSSSPIRLPVEPTPETEPELHFGPEVLDIALRIPAGTKIRNTGRSPERSRGSVSEQRPQEELHPSAPSPGRVLPVMKPAALPSGAFTLAAVVTAGFLATGLVFPYGLLGSCMNRIAKRLLPLLLFSRENDKKVRKGRKGKKVATLLMIVLLLGSIGVPALSVQAATTAPQRIVYNGHLLDSSGTPVTTAVSVRFSFWNSADYVTGDVSAGAINTSASTYASWNEVHTVTPNSQGYFSLEMGGVTSLPDFSGISTETLLSLYLQVEVKASSAANTAYELLDFDTSSTTSDRSPMRSVPSALNADFVDKREVGTGSGNIAILGPGAVFNPARMPGGTNSGTFLIDYDGSETSSVTLQFGRTLGKSLVYDGSNSRFNFDDDVRIQGDLTVTGLINGINISTVSGNAPLKVSSGAGLNLTINAGSYRLNGSFTNYGGGSSIAVTNNTTNYVFFGSGGLTVSTVGFPTDESAVRLAQVVTSGGAITSVADRRVTSADDRERTIEQYYRAAFENAAYKADDTSNVGQLSVTHDSTSKRNHYAWTSTRSALQDYDIYLRVSLGSDFISWVDNPLRVTYRSTTGTATDNKLDIAVYDTAGTAVTLSGSSTSLANTSWTTTQLEFSGTPTFTAGQDFLVKFTVFAKDQNALHLGEATVLYRELLQ